MFIGVTVLKLQNTQNHHESILLYHNTVLLRKCVVLLQLAFNFSRIHLIFNKLIIRSKDVVDDYLSDRP